MSAHSGFSVPISDGGLGPRSSGRSLWVLALDAEIDVGATDDRHWDDDEDGQRARARDDLKERSEQVEEEDRDLVPLGQLPTSLERVHAGKILNEDQEWRERQTEDEDVARNHAEREADADDEAADDPENDEAPEKAASAEE